MGLPVDLEVRPESGGSVLPIPLSTTGAEGKAQVWAVRNEKGATLIKADSQTSVVTVGGIALGVPYYTSTSARDAAITSPVNGMMIINEQVSAVQVYVGGEWLSMAVA